jgi:hypothetical protein
LTGRPDHGSGSGIAGRSPNSDLGGLTLPIPENWLAALTDAVADRLRQEASARSTWLTRPQLADRLGVPVSRIEKDRRIPCHRWDGRVLYHADEVDEWLLSQGPR